MIHRASLAATLAALATGAGAAEPTALAVEYFNTTLGHYFVTADPAEMRSVEGGGAGPGWIRTGGQFGVFARADDAPGLTPVCRFYGTPGIGPNSHFYAADPAECERVKGDRGWTYEGIGFYALPASPAGCGSDATPVYRSYNNGFARNDSNHRFTVDPTVFARAPSTGYQPEGVAMCAALSAADRQADAARLLRQASFGASEADIARAASLGPAGWIAEQMAMPATQYPAYGWVAANRPDSCVDDRTQPLRPDSFCARDNYTLYRMQLQFFANALAQPDQLRARVAFALSQVMVTSGVDNARNYAMRHYQQIFLDRAFGDFEGLLTAVTLSPMMGDYLDMANNNKSNVAAGTDPNENYAREILQLFSVGTYLLNRDGTRQLDAQGRPLFTYDQAQVKGFSRVFTGWTYPPAPGAASRNNNPRSYQADMVPVDVNHEFGTKVLLSGVVGPAGLTVREDLAFAIRNIVQHPNVGPFIGRQLIQKLVTSDPTPAYVARVAAAFDDNGSGRRGDLGAVVRAVLLDPEARGARKIDPGYGKLQEPVLFATSLARAFGGRSDGLFFRGASQQLGQFVFYPPSVFNYYPADYTLGGSERPAPEFGVQNTATAIARSNVANALLFTTIAPDTATLYGATGTQLDLAPFQAIAGDATALVDRLDRLMMAGAMSPAMKASVVRSVQAIAATDTLGRVRTAAYLVAASAAWQVQR